VYLLDDVFSAVDSHIGSYLFEKLVLGSLKQTTRVLVTHYLHLLPSVDNIIILDEG
jgi:ABC-type multidrug transport system fused ATPase/permease subunit